MIKYHKLTYIINKNNNTEIMNYDTKFISLFYF